MPKYFTRNQTDNSVLARIRRQGCNVQTTFLLSKYKTWEKAEAAAKRWIKVKLAEVPPPLARMGRMSQRNSSGVVGVRLADGTRRKNGYVYPDWRWVAFWPSCPNTGGIGWSINKYGDNPAFVRAYIARQSESVDREAIEAEFLKLKEAKLLKTVLKLKVLKPS